MFPRPSRFTRLSILAVSASVFFVFFYVLAPGLVETSPPSSPAAERREFEPSRFTTRIASDRQDTRRAFKKVAVLTDRVTAAPRIPPTAPPPPPAAVAAAAAAAVSVNPHNFQYIHNPEDICLGARRDLRPPAATAPGRGPHQADKGQSRNVTLLIYIHSAPGNLKKRQAVRQTWGHPVLLSQLSAAVIFLMGKPPSARQQAMIDMEASEYGDLVQEDFMDAYRNLTYKGVAGLRWISQFCPSAIFLLKTDDDILVDIVSLVSDLRKRYPAYPALSLDLTKPGSTSAGPQQHRPPSGVVLCNLWTRMKVMRDPKSKWFIPPAEFAPDYFPPYCSGSAFVLSADLAPRMYRASLDAPFFWVDDYYVTGVLVKAVGAAHARYNQVYLLNANLAESRLANGSRETLFIHVKKLALFLKLWPMMLRRHSDVPEIRRLIPEPAPTPNSVVGWAPRKQPSFQEGGPRRKQLTYRQGNKKEVQPRTHSNDGGKVFLSNIVTIMCLLERLLCASMIT